MSLSFETAIRNTLVGAPLAITGTYSAVINSDGTFTVQFTITPSGGAAQKWRVVGDTMWPLDTANQ